MASSNMILKLLVDKRVQKVLYAEASKEFVDLLFHIFALPLGTLIKFPSSKQMVGCLGKLKESIETLNQTHLQPDHDKPSASKAKTLFMCSYAPGSIPFDGYGFCGLRHVSDHQDARCLQCGRLMNVPMTFVRWPSNEEAVVKETVTYMVMDDLVIKPMSTITSITLINNYGVKDLSQLEEIALPFGKDEAFELLKLSLMTDQVLTTLFRHIKEA
ncbi:unnamed protein product [Lactuca saligna]|uniref:Uncharacterized protein n=1 Tax=Lactuca saligna TaxID=75948 RepID=A0AA36EKP8_LACSI|nr:unnamed protein product [Lactuca saligna]